MEGYVMRRKENQKRSWSPFSSSGKSWRYWYLVLHGRMLHYYVKKGDTVAKKSFALLPGCTITGPISVHSYLWTFEITFPDDYTQKRTEDISLLELPGNNSSVFLRNSSNTSTGSAGHRRRGSGDVSDLLATDQHDFNEYVASHSKSRRSSGKKFGDERDHVSKRVNKAQKNIKKKTQKLAADEFKAPTKRDIRRRTAEFGLPNAKVCRKWVNAIRTAIEHVSAESADVGIDGTGPQRDRAPMRIHSRPHSVSSPEGHPGSMMSPAHRTSFAAITSSRYSELKAQGDGDDGDDGVGDGVHHDIAYVVHRVDGNMVVHRETAPDDNPTVMDIQEKTSEYNETVYMSAILGLVSGVLLNWFNYGVSIQLLLGIVVALIPWMFRVYNDDAREEERIPTYMTTQIVRGSPEYIFNAIIVEEYRIFWDIAVSSMTVLEKRDSQCDIVHMILKPVWIPFFCIWSKTRELVLLRYWRREQDGSYYVANQSTDHADAPVNDQFRRAHMPSSAWIIRPRQTNAVGGVETCSVTFMVKYDAGGIAPFLNKLGGFDYIFSRPFLNSVASLADCLKILDYVHVPPKPDLDEELFDNDPAPLPKKTPMKPSLRQRTMSIDNTKIRVNPAGLIVGVKQRTVSAVESTFAEPSPKQFKVRGPNYLTDKVKIPAERSVFHLVSFDVYSFENPDERYNIGARKGSFASLFKDSPKRKGKHFTYIINLIMPSDDNLALVLCYQPEDPNWRESNDPWARLFKSYIESDPNTDFFKTRFKLIPKIIEANFMIRKTVPCKPALLANKGLTVPFHRDEHYFEVDVDITSDSTARFITKLCLGASRSIVVDMAFLVESKQTEELPETIIGTVRCSRVDLRKHKKIKAEESLGYES